MKIMSLIIVALFSNPVTSMQDDSWSDLTSFDIDIDSSSEVAVLDVSSIRIHWIPSFNLTWMNARVSWRLNVIMESYMAALVRFAPITSCGPTGTNINPLSRWLSCDQMDNSDTLLATDVVTKSNSAIFKGVQFNTSYYLWIGLLYHGDEIFWQDCREEISPNCSGTIYGDELCQQSCKPAAQPVYDVKVDSIIGTDLKDNSSHEVTISWFCPVGYRENVEEYYIVFNNLNNNSTIYYDAQIPQTFSLRQEVSIMTHEPDVVMFDKYEILVVPVVINNHNQSQLGPASQLLLTLEPIVPTTVAVDSTYLVEEKWFTTENAGSVTATTEDQFSPNTGNSLTFSLISVCVAIGVLLIVLIVVLLVRRNRKRHSTSTTECHAEEFDEMMIGVKHL